MERIGQLINGKMIYEPPMIYQHPTRTLPVYNPATGMMTAELEIATPSVIDKAVQAAKAAFNTWSQTPIKKRVKILFNYIGLIQSHIDELAMLVTEEHGKTLTEAKASILRGLEVVELAYRAPLLLKGDYSPTVSDGISCYSIYEPLGVCAGITPFNFPVMIPLWMFPIAIAAGNTFILKPSERCPRTPTRLVELLYEAGLPDNVVQVIHGDKTVVDYLLEHPEISAISSVSSTPVAKYIYETGTRHHKRVQAFGGAKNHGVIMPDVPVETVATQLVEAAFGSTGQRCMALSVVILVGDEIAQKLIPVILSKSQQIQTGSGLEPKTSMGPLNNVMALERVKQAIALGVEEGAELILDGRISEASIDQKGFFIRPSIFDKVTPAMHIYQDEIFGPILCLVRVNTLEEAIALINANPYANGTAIFTQNGQNADTFSRKIQVGMVGINVPVPVPAAEHIFGGWKNSFFGDIALHAEEGIKFYTRHKTITERWLIPESTHF
jgi:malonate-semialdehyde dehydrogenase (acetylating) / methylmalonate-semialdehyde dehydrogenase